MSTIMTIVCKHPGNETKPQRFGAKAHGVYLSNVLRFDALFNDVVHVATSDHPEPDEECSGPGKGLQPS